MTIGTNTTTLITKKPPEEWRYEDFENEEPYEWIYQQKDNRFMMQQTLSAMEKVAKKLGFKDFKAFWRAYVESKNPRPTVIGGEYDTIFPDQPIQLKSGKYMCDEFGVCYINEMGAGVEVISHPIMPVARVVDLQSGETSLKLAFQRGSRDWRYIVVPKRISASASKIVDALAPHDIAVNSENAKEVVKYISFMESANYEDIAEIKQSSKLGWWGDSFLPYDDAVEITDNKFANNIKQHGDFETWIQCVKDIRTGEKRYLPARMDLAASFASPLLARIGYLPFWCNTHSTISGCGKTVCLMLAASIWGNPEVGRGIPMVANSTVNSLEVVASQLNNVPLFLDEVSTTTSSGGLISPL